MAVVGEVLTVGGWFLAPVTSKLMKDFLKKSFWYLGSDIPKEIEDLETTLLPEIMLTIQAAQHSSPNHKAELAKWIENLKKAYIDAKDILENRPSKKKLLQRLKKLKEVVARAKNLRDLLVTDGNIHLISSSILINRVFGRDGVCEEIINFLSVEQGESSSRKSYSVAAITGVEGVGKTTVARYVFNDERIKNYFPVRMWLNLSTNLNTIEHTKEMIECVSEKECPNIHNLDVLQKKLIGLLESDNIIIVLDNVWYDNNNRVLGENWDTLLAPFAFRKGICKIVVTSRSTLLPSALLPGKRFGLCNLELADFKSLLQYHAIDGLQISNNPQLTNNVLSDLIDRQSIVDQIAEKMSTMGKQPSDAKAVGNYLCQHPDITDWQNTLNQTDLFSTIMSNPSIF